MTKAMPYTDSPDVGHSFDGDALQESTRQHLLQYKNAIDPKRTPAQRKTERQSQQNPEQLSIWDAMASR